MIIKEYDYDGIATVWIKQSLYKVGERVRLDLIDYEDGIPFATATINLPEVDLEPEEVIIKDGQENEGMLDFLYRNGIVGPVKRYARSGYLVYPVVDLLI